VRRLPWLGAMLLVAGAQCGSPKSDAPGFVVEVSITPPTDMVDATFRVNGIPTFPDAKLLSIRCTFERSEFEDSNAVLSVTENGKTQDLPLSRNAACRNERYKREGLQVLLARKDGTITAEVQSYCYEAHTSRCEAYPWKK
jgi:hypothetical protein